MMTGSRRSEEDEDLDLQEWFKKYFYRRDLRSPRWVPCIAQRLMPRERWLVRPVPVATRLKWLVVLGIHPFLVRACTWINRGGVVVALAMGKRICRISPRLPWLI